jgi:hypothetical protein
MTTNATASRLLTCQEAAELLRASAHIASRIVITLWMSQGPANSAGSIRGTSRSRRFTKRISGYQIA